MQNIDLHGELIIDILEDVFNIIKKLFLDNEQSIIFNRKIYYKPDMEYLKDKNCKLSKYLESGETKCKFCDDGIITYPEENENEPYMPYSFIGMCNKCKAVLSDGLSLRKSMDKEILCPNPKCGEHIKPKHCFDLEDDKEYYHCSKCLFT